MPTRKYKTDPAQLLAEGQEIVHTTSDAKYRHREEMVNLVLSGLTPSYISTYCGSSKRTITLWVKIADEQGFAALKPKKPTGKPPKLTKEQMTEILRSCIHRRGMLDGRGIFPSVKANFRRNTWCISRKFNADRRKKTRPDGV